MHRVGIYRRPALWTVQRHSHQPWQPWARLLATLTLWICVSISLRFGYYGNSRMVLGPSSSRLIEANSVFVEQIHVREDGDTDVHLYAFDEMPQLSYEANWTVSDYLIVASYHRKEFSLWLNEGSKIRMRWETRTSTLKQLEVAMIKGEKNRVTLMPTLISSSDSLSPNEPLNGTEAEYIILEDDKYNILVVNGNARSIIMTISVNVSSKMYDISKAKRMCSTVKDSCGLSIQFPGTRYVVLTTPNNGALGEWNIELSYVARAVTYIAVLAFIMIIIFVVLKYLGACENEDNVEERETTDVNTETDPLISNKPIHVTYGTRGEDEESGASSSSSDQELYDEKLCVICYDEQRNCFFVPCGHCATCYDCAQRIMEGDNKVCPICRRLIHKVRRLFNS